MDDLLRGAFDGIANSGVEPLPNPKVADLNDAGDVA